MQSFWILVIATIAYTYFSGESIIEIIFLSAFLICAGMLQLAGSFVYLGHTEMLAGWNTMTFEKRSKYDYEKMTSFLGISWVVTAFVSFSASFVLLVTMDYMDAFVVFFVLYLALLLLSVICVNTKRFKIQS